jgi:hypothetical protein
VDENLAAEVKSVTFHVTALFVATVMRISDLSPLEHTCILVICIYN